MPVGDIPGWHQVFADDFTTAVRARRFSGCRAGPTLMTSSCSGLPAAVARKWWAYPDGWKDTGKGTYYPSKVLSIEHGILDYYIHTGTVRGKRVHMVAALVPRISGTPDGGLLYGRYVIRFRAAALPGYHAAFLLWPDSNDWPLAGEIDFPEGNLDQRVYAFMHPQGAIRGSQQDAYATRARFTSWHTATIDWTRSHCRFILDGKVIGTSSAGIPATPLHWVLQVNANGGGLPGLPPSTKTAGIIQIAWVTAYAPGVAATRNNSPSLLP
jgi:Glycosyl hydrolases family 16